MISTPIGAAVSLARFRQRRVEMELKGSLAGRFWLVEEDRTGGAVIEDG